jgi:hypothetical protein
MVCVSFAIVFRSSRTRLLELFTCFKSNGTYQQRRLFCSSVTARGTISKQAINTRIRRATRYLAKTMSDVRGAAASRRSVRNQLPHVFGSHVVGCFDTFPIYIHRPSSRRLRSISYDGKKKRFALKVFVDNRFVIIAVVLYMRFQCSNFYSFLFILKVCCDSFRR